MHGSPSSQSLWCFSRVQATRPAACERPTAARGLALIRRTLREQPAMTDRVRVRPGPRRLSRGALERVGDPVPEDPRPERSEARSALEIVHAQYHRALTLAARSEPAERAAALAEARRLLAVAVALRARVTDQDVGSAAPRAPAERHGPAHWDP
jgi:hypothetical protein